MAVSKTQPWITETSGDPSGTVTIGSGTNRCLILIRGIEHNTASASGSCAIGGVTATGRGVSSMNDGGEYQQVLYFYWDESDLQSMSGNTISWSDGVVQTKTFWTYATFASVDQTTVLIAGATTGTATSANPFRMPTVGVSGDWSICHLVTNASSSYEWDANITENFDSSLQSTFSYTMADGSWKANYHEARPRLVSTNVVGHGIVLKAAGGGAGSGNLVAPAASVSAPGTVGINNLINPQPQVAAVGERTIVWTGKVELFAAVVSAGSASADIPIQAQSTVELAPGFIEFFAIGDRGVIGTGAASAPSGTTDGTLKLVLTGSGSCDAPVALVAGDDLYNAFWYTAKSVYFLGV